MPPADQERPSRNALALRGAGTLLALALTVYLLSQQGWQEIASAAARLEPWRLALSFLLMMVSRLAVTARWHVLLRCAQMEITAWQSLRITFAGLFATNFLPTTIGGDVVRLAGAIQLKFDAAISAASLVADRLVGMAGMAIVVPLGLLLVVSQPPPQAFSPLRLSLSRNQAPPVLATLVPTGSWLRRLWEKTGEFFRRLLAALALWLRQPGSLLHSLAWSWVHMLCTFAILALLLNGMGEPMPWWQIAGLYSLVYFVTLLPISINGYGVQELSMTFAFSRFGGVSLATSLTAALLFRTLMMVASLPGALFVPGIMAGSRQRTF
jgi:hypothetical protein